MAALGLHLAAWFLLSPGTAGGTARLLPSKRPLIAHLQLAEKQERSFLPEENPQRAATATSAAVAAVPAAKTGIGGTPENAGGSGSRASTPPGPPSPAMANPQPVATDTAAAPASAFTHPGDYRPATELTEPPRPPADMAFPSPPEDVVTTERQTGTFTLFVETDGSVSQAVIDGPTLAPGLEVLARQTFIASRFTPGSVNGRPVKALLRIEVTFDAVRLEEIPLMPTAVPILTPLK